VPRDFQPGNTDPKRYVIHAASVAVLAIVAAGGTDTEILSQFLDEREAVVLRSYKDGKQIWTACRGLTRIHGQAVTPNMTFTKEECDQYDQVELEATLNALHFVIKPEVYATLTPPARAGIASFCVYNIGEPLCRGSTFLKLLNKGPDFRNQACAQITYWIRDGGKDCRVDRSCRGQVPRRMAEDELCLHGVTWGVD
jgi:lysozyme